MSRIKLTHDIYDQYEQVQIPEEGWPEEGEDYKPLDELISEDPMEVNQHIVASNKGQNSFGFKVPEKAHCGGHSGNTPLFKVPFLDDEGEEIHTKYIAGASGMRLDPQGTELVVDCAGLYSSGTSDEPFVECGVGADEFQSLADHVIDPPILRLHWQDMGVPPVKYSFWAELLELLPAGVTKICCHGGHGRTGTALAALYLTAQPDATAEEAIELVRQKHCSRAIETAGQESYLHELAGERDALLAKTPDE